MLAKEYFKPLTGIRAVAAIMVFFHHFPLPLPFGINEQFNFQRELHIGVTIFYVLSGFLIAYRYQNIDLMKFSEFKKYILNRFARLYPVYVAILLILLYFNFKVSIETFWQNFFLYKGFFDQLKFDGIGQSWSLTVEFTFYFFAPVIFYLIRRVGYWKSLLYLVFISLTLYMVFNVVLIDEINATKLNSLLNPTKFYLLYTFGGRFFEFFVGILLAKIILQNQKNSFQYFTWAGSLGVVTILGLLTIVCSRYQTAYGLHHPIGIILNNIVLPFAIATLLYGLMIEVTIVSKMLSSKFFHYLGVSSYCFYLIHVDLCSLMKGLTGSLIFDKIYLNLLFVVIVSLLLHYTIEEPCNNLLKKLFRNDKIS